MCHLTADPCVCVSTRLTHMHVCVSPRLTLWAREGHWAVMPRACEDREGREGREGCEGRKGCKGRGAVKLKGS